MNVTIDVYGTKYLQTSQPVRAFSDGSRTKSFSVEAGRVVRAWDSVAGYYTCAHSLTQRQQAAIRRLAKTK